MCDGGGGDDGGAAQRETARQAKQDDAIRQIDELFGIDRDYGTTTRSRIPGSGVIPDWQYTTSDSTGAKTKAQANKAEREKMYGTVRDDVINFHRQDLDKQSVDAKRNGKFSLAEHGLTGGSVDIDLGRELQDRYLKGVMAVTNKGDAAANDMRGADTRTRLDMVGRINAGADASTALNGAVGEMAANASNARDSALAQASGSFFDDVAFLQRARSDFINGQQLQQTMGQYFPGKTSTSGSGGMVTKVGS